MEREPQREAVGNPSGHNADPAGEWEQEELTTLPRRGTVSTNEIHLASLKLMAISLLRQIETLETQITADKAPTLNLHKEVQKFEAAIIRSALLKTGGRQRRAARLLGVKVTTLNSKIKRLGITIDQPFCESEVDQVSPVNH